MRKLPAIRGAAVGIVFSLACLVVPSVARATDRVVGNGTPSSCTSAAVVAAVRAGGTIRFACGPRPVTILMRRTATVLNTSRRVVLDGGGRVTLSGGGRRRILYMDTCDPDLVWTTSHCQDQASPQLVVDGMRFERGRAPGAQRVGATGTSEVAGGGAIFAFGGQLRIERSTFVENRCTPSDAPDSGGGAVSAQWQDGADPVEIVDSRFRGNVCESAGTGGGGGAVFATQGRLRIDRSTFDENRCIDDGPDVGGGAVRAFVERASAVQVTDSSFTGNVCSNGAALSSLGVSWTVRGSSFTANRAIGIGANPARPGTPGGGDGGAIYNDGDGMTLSICDSTFEANDAREGGGAVYFVSDDRAGTLDICDSRLIDNPNAGFQTAGLPGIFFIGARAPTIRHTVLR